MSNANSKLYSDPRKAMLFSIFTTMWATMCSDQITKQLHPHKLKTSSFKNTFNTLSTGHHAKHKF